MKFSEDVAKFSAYATPSQLPVKFGVSISRISCITLIVFYLLFFSLLRDTTADYSLIMSLYV